MRIIGLCGKPRAGKNAAAEIAAQLVPGTAIINFSDEIVAECAVVLLSVGETVGEWIEKINADKEHYRPFLQWYGFVHKRREDEEYWVKKIEAKLNAAEAAGAPLAVVCGVRAFNEWVMIKKRGGAVLQVVRGVQEWVPSYEHACENQRIPIDGTIKNMDGIGELSRGVERVVRYAMREERRGGISQNSHGDKIAVASGVLEE